MKVKDYIKEKLFNPEDFYYQIIGNNFPIKYQKTGKYLKNIFNLYGEYNKELVLLSIKYFDYFSKYDFNFENFDNYILHNINSIVINDYKALFEFYDNVFIKKNYKLLYDVFIDLINGQKYYPVQHSDTNSALSYLFVIYDVNKENIRLLTKDSNEKMFKCLLLKDLTILYWVNNNLDWAQELYLIVDNILLRDNFMEKCMIKGFDTNSFSFYQIDYIANLIYKKEFNTINDKIIK